jgi:hypothetical protein
MPINKQFVTVIKKSITKIDFSKLEEKCTNEAQTRQYLIEPIIETLGYSRFDDMLTEINAGWGQKNDKADIGLALLKNKEPEIIIECKKYGKSLTDKEANQLNGYFNNTFNIRLNCLGTIRTKILICQDNDIIIFAIYKNSNIDINDLMHKIIDIIKN